MTQQIDKAKLKAAAEHLEWVLSQYPAEPPLQDLLSALLPLITAAKRGAIDSTIKRSEVPGGYAFGDGAYRPFEHPSVERAYVDFRIELRGGLTHEEELRHARMNDLWAAKQTGNKL